MNSETQTKECRLFCGGCEEYTVKKKTMETEYRGYIISQDITGYAPKDSQFAFFLDDGELYCGRGESIEDCKKQIDEL